MKKSKAILAGALALGLGLGGVALAGCDFGGSQNLEFRVYGDYIQWTNDGENWDNIISIDEIKGKDGNTWTISDDGYWCVNGEKTDFVAVGKDGKPGQAGNGIVSIH